MIFTEEEKKLIPEGGALGSTAKEDVQAPDLTEEQWKAIRENRHRAERNRTSDWYKP